MHLKKKQIYRVKKKNGNEVLEQFSFPQIQLDMIEPNVCLVSTTMDFVSIFTDFCDAKMWVYDGFRFGSEKNIPTSFVFFCGSLVF